MTVPISNRRDLIRFRIRSQIRRIKSKIAWLRLKKIVIVDADGNKHKFGIQTVKFQPFRIDSEPSESSEDALILNQWNWIE